jgi:DNA-binding transcriptional LysR family regulator
VQPSPDARQPLRIAIAPGVTVSKWTGRFQERHPGTAFEVVRVAEADGVSVLHSGRATVSFVRLPIDRDGLSVIRLYAEAPVLVVSRESALAGREPLTMAEVGELSGVADYPTVGDAKDAVALVAAGVFALRLPHSVARSSARKDVVAIPIADGPETEIAICWIAAEVTDLIEEFVGIVRGRTAASSRSTPTPPTPPKERVRRVAQPTKPRRTPKRPRRQGR